MAINNKNRKTSVLDLADQEPQKETKTPKGPGVSDSKNDGNGIDIIPTSDYKVNDAGKKYRAHRIIFNKGEDDKKTMGVTEQMKKTYKELSEVLAKNAAAGEWIHDFVHSDNPKFAGKSKEMRKKMALAAYYAKQQNEDKQVIRKEEAMEENWDAMLAHSKKMGDATRKSTKTYHDIKKTSTGTVYTKQFDKDGTSKGTGGDAAAKAEGAPKRGRGRPKKDKFAESVEMLMSLSEEQFDSMMEEGFDAFFEAYEQLDELSKTTLGSYAKKAAVDAKFKGFDAGHQEGGAQARSKTMYGGSGAGSATDDKAHKRLRNVSKAIDRLTK